MFLNNKQIEELWKIYSAVESKIVNLKSIVQNPLKLKDEDLNRHREVSCLI